MNRRKVSCALCAFVYGVVMPVCSGAQDVPASGVRPSPITVYITVTGNSVALPLDKSLLRAEIDKKPAKIESVRPVNSDPLLFVVLMDESASVRPNFDTVKDASLTIFKGLSAGAGNLGSLDFFNDVLSFTSRPVTTQEAQRLLARESPRGGTALYDSLGQLSLGVLSRSKNPESPRRAIIVITDGDDNASKLKFDEGLPRAQEEGIAIFVLCTDPHGRGEHVLSELSAKTGGQEVRPRSIAEGAAPLLNAIAAQWAVTILPQQIPDEKLHTLSIHSEQTHLLLSAPAKIPLQ